MTVKSSQPAQAQAKKTMANWVSALADNIKNPIAGVTAALDIIEEETQPKLDEGTESTQRVEEAFRLIRHRLARLNLYVSELADFAKPARVFPAVVRVEPLIEQAVEAVKAENGFHPLDMQTQAGAETLFADGEVLREILSGLVLNSLEAIGHERNPVLKITAEPDRKQTGVYLTVEDNGPGISPTEARRLVQPFESTKEAGTGLGLALAKKYVTAHGGTLNITRSRSLGGCSIRLFFPNQESNASATD